MAKPRKSRPTMLDVADLSGVSYQTVSRVINNHPYVSEDTRKKVQDAIDVLGYRPSKAAIKLRAKSSRTIAIILYGGWFYGPVQIALNVEMAAKTSGFDVIFTNVTETEQQVTEALQHVKDWVVDGIICIVPAQGLPQDELQAISGDIPIVHIDSRPAGNLASVRLDDAAGTQQIVEHLISYGHTRFCEISGPLNWYSAQIRHQTCVREFQSYGIEPPLHIEGNWTTPGGYQATRRLLEQGHSFSAVIAANDSMALGVLYALHQFGIAVPDEVSVVGFDDIPEAAYFIPPLTTMRNNYIQLGTAGFEYLMHLMDDPDTPMVQKVIAPKLVVRDSTRSAKA
jgi:DNA-binding LacI/PurR family transcriptional regulator